MPFRFIQEHCSNYHFDGEWNEWGKKGFYKEFQSCRFFLVYSVDHQWHLFLLSFWSTCYFLLLFYPSKTMSPLFYPQKNNEWEEIAISKLLFHSTFTLILKVAISFHFETGMEGNSNTHIYPLLGTKRVYIDLYINQDIIDGPNCTCKLLKHDLKIPVFRWCFIFLS